jgi:chromosomal replication initiator protein
MTHPLQRKVEAADWWRDHLRSRCRRGAARMSAKRIVLIAQVIVAVSEYYGLSPEEVTAKDRTGDALRARQIGMFLSRRMTQRSYPEIGKRWGGFDHSTVVHACRKIEGLLDTNPEVRTDVDTIAGAVLSGW